MHTEYLQCNSKNIYNIYIYFLRMYQYFIRGGGGEGIFIGYLK